jgi:hypothetical protein
MRSGSWFWYLVLPLIVLLIVVLVQRELGGLAPAPPVDVSGPATQQPVSSRQVDPAMPVILIPQPEEPVESGFLPEDEWASELSKSPAGRSPMEIELVEPAEVAGLVPLPMDLK